MIAPGFVIIVFMIKDEAFGVIPVFRESDGGLSFLVVKHKAGHWAFPKGHADPGETHLETARRELFEETGIKEIEIIENKTFSERYESVIKKTGESCDKTVIFFVGFVESKDVATPENFQDEIPEARWVEENEVEGILTYPEAKEIFRQVYEFLQAK